MLISKAKKTMVLSVLMVVLMAAGAFAHCIWVEVPTSVSVGEPFQALAFYADPDDPVEERDMTELSLYAIAPDGEAHPIDLVKGETYQQAAITLSEEGQWRLALEREPNRYRLQEIRDFGKSLVWVGQTGTWVHEPVELSLEIMVESERETAEGLFELVLSVQYEGTPVSGAEVEVFRSLAEDPTLYEEIDELESDVNGQVTVTVNPEHLYVFETDHRLPARDVQGVGRFITEVRFRSTLFLGSR